MTFRAILEARQNHYQEARALLEQVISQDSGLDMKARAHLELGNVLDKLAEYQLAFPMLEQAGLLAMQLPEVCQFDKKLVARRISHYRTDFDFGLLQRWPRDLIPDEWPVPTFLLGFLRSGTTLTEQVLAAHPDIITGDESDLIYGLAEELKRLCGGQENTQENLKRIGLPEILYLRAYYWQHVLAKFGDKALEKCFVDKTALNTIDIALINALFPEARVIFALRDPRDICLSCFM